MAANGGAGSFLLDLHEHGESIGRRLGLVAAEKVKRGDDAVGTSGTVKVSRKNLGDESMFAIKNPARIGRTFGPLSIIGRGVGTGNVGDRGSSILCSPTERKAVEATPD